MSVLEYRGLPVLCQAYLQEVVFEMSPSDHKTCSIRCHLGILVGFTSILHSLTPLVPQAQCEANLDRLRLFHQWECLKCNGHWLSISCVKWFALGAKTRGISSRAITTSIRVLCNRPTLMKQQCKSIIMLWKFLHSTNFQWRMSIV